MKTFDIPTIQKDAFIIELSKDITIGHLVHYAYPYTGAGKCMITSGFRFTITNSMRDDAFYMHPVNNDNESEEFLISQLYKDAKLQLPELANRIQGFSFYLTEEQIKSDSIKFIRGDRNVLLGIIAKQKERTAYWEDPDNQCTEMLKQFDGSFMKEYDECGKPKVLKEETNICPGCGSKMRRVYWGEITPDIIRQKKEGLLFIGEELYGKQQEVDYKQKYGDYKCIQEYSRPDYACGNCGDSYVLEQL